MKFLERGFEFNKLAKAFNSAFVMINEIEVKINSSHSSEYSDFEQDLFIMAYVCRRDMMDRMEKYGWIMTTPIVVPMISKGRLTLIFVYQQTIGRLVRFAELLNVSGEVNEILQKGDAYFKIDSIIPNQMKNQL